MPKVSEFVFKQDVQVYVELIQEGQTTWGKAAQSLRDEYHLTYAELRWSGAIETLQKADKNFGVSTPSS